MKVQFNPATLLPLMIQNARFSGRNPDDSFTYGSEYHTDPRTGRRYIERTERCGMGVVESSTPVDDDGHPVDSEGRPVEWDSQRGGWVLIDMTK